MVIVNPQHDATQTLERWAMDRRLRRGTYRLVDKPAPKRGEPDRHVVQLVDERTGRVLHKAHYFNVVM